MDLVVGGTGLLGGEICRQLVAKGRDVKALVRPTADPKKLEALRDRGVKLIQGDLKNFSSLRAACEGIDAIVCAASTLNSRQEGDSIQTVDRDGQLSLVDAAESAGIMKCTIVSCPEKPELSFPLSAGRRAVEERLRRSGVDHTVVQANFFMEAWLSPERGFDYHNGKARILGEGNNKISWVSCRDVAKFAVISLESPRAKDSVIQVGGPQALSPLEVVRIFEDAGKRKFEVEHVPVEELKAQKAAAQDPLRESISALLLQMTMDNVMDMTETLKAFPVKMTSVREYAEAALKG
jgi:uncharacterized protein YbjT (DUF2867 family)